MSYIELDKDNPDWLLCPECHNFNLHHGRVTIFDRPQEDAPSCAIVVEDGMASREDGNGNPSSRRGGVAIRFWCESCAAIPELTIAQHKGTTVLAWRVVGHFLKEEVLHRDGSMMISA
jgi:hypothetical protein